MGDQTTSKQSTSGDSESTTAGAPGLVAFWTGAAQGVVGFAEHELRANAKPDPSAIALVLVVIVGCGRSVAPNPPERAAIPIAAGDAFAPVSRCHAADWSLQEQRDVAAFRIDVEPVGCAEWDACVAAGKCRDRAIEDCRRSDRGTLKLVRVDGAREFCAWHGARLPTLAEWSRGARGEGRDLQPDAARACLEVDGKRIQRCSYIGPTGMRYSLLTELLSEWTSEVDCLVTDDAERVPIGVALSEGAARRDGGTVAAFRCARDGAARPTK